MGRNDIATPARLMTLFRQGQTTFHAAVSILATSGIKFLERSLCGLCCVLRLLTLAASSENGVLPVMQAPLMQSPSESRLQEM